ncbi:adenylate cyclase [Leptolyngbya sp. 'hensonii']|uniref:CYTH domain-containing protein n=1 Tax=Leptolyngbya sp. 'hensonii' TaxID=1922337 RepID=UPI00094F637F|nr:CYTH domain-containing protein [Leptolyngbya sp. 'hensonii']OLP19298.1 adenylate cyclase [Leptolyngbya sp. 'hensonii']
MAIEIERKFLVNGEAWRSLGQGTPYRQGYIATVNGTTVRVRIAGTQGYITLKGFKTVLARSEFEYPIPLEDAATLLEQFCDRPLIEKVRYRIPIGDLVWEVDEFTGENQGLIVAEVELQDEQQAIELPDWVGAEVSHDPRYLNANLVRHPYSRW